MEETNDAESLAPTKTGGIASRLPLLTARLRIRPFSWRDQSRLAELNGNSGVTRYAGGGKRSPEESSRILKAIIQRTASTGFAAFAVEESFSQNLLGWCGVQYHKQLNDYGLLYALHPDYWGKGLATEAAQAVVTLFFSIRPSKADRIVGVAFPANLNSIAVLEKLGMRFTGNYFDLCAQSIASIYSLRRLDFFLHINSG